MKLTIVLIFCLVSLRIRASTVSIQQDSLQSSNEIDSKCKEKFKFCAKCSPGNEKCQTCENPYYLKDRKCESCGEGCDSCNEQGVWSVLSVISLMDITRMNPRKEKTNV